MTREEAVRQAAVALIEIQREVVALQGWRWMPGMRAMRSDDPEWRWPVDHFRIVRTDDEGAWLAADDEPGNEEDAPTYYSWAELAAFLPDLADPATLGCLMALVREARGAPFGQVSPAVSWPSPDRIATATVWIWYDNTGADEPRPHGPTEAHALVAALRAAGAR